MSYGAQRPYIAGQVVSLEGTFVDVASGDPVDPTTVVLVYRVASTAPVTYVYGAEGSPIERESAGVYSAEIDTTGLPGTWVYEWASQDTGQGIQAGSFVVNPPPLVPDVG